MSTEELFKAVNDLDQEQCDLEKINELIAAGADVNGVDANGSTPLMWASFNCTLPVVQALIDASANINAQRSDNGTALLYALGNLYGKDEAIKIIEVLIAQGADTSLRKGEDPEVFEEGEFTRTLNVGPNYNPNANIIKQNTRETFAYLYDNLIKTGKKSMWSTKENAYMPSGLANKIKSNFKYGIGKSESPADTPSRSVKGGYRKTRRQSRKSRRQSRKSRRQRQSRRN